MMRWMPGEASRLAALLATLLATASGLALAGCTGEPGGEQTGETAGRAAGAPRAATWVGRATCAECHPREHELWRGSHHDLAMQEATGETVLGDFDGATFTHFGVTSTFFRRAGGFFVRTDGPGGEPGEYRIAYTFGVEPLQQYLIEMPGGRFQALSVCWDTRPEEEGGQRWFHLYPDEPVPHDDPLHWTGLEQRWNYMCAECHSTGLVKGYRFPEDRYQTRFEEIDVSCEACHGPGSRHVEWARRAAGGGEEGEEDLGLEVQLAEGATWIFEREGPTARRSARPGSRAQVETCGRCHARRAPLAPYRYGRPLADSYRVSLLTEGLYHADGQILDEVYVYGSFLQSPMYREGVTCSDCHDPHSARLRAAGNALCGRCHRPSELDTPEHHHHPPGSAGAVCVECHMPARNYMVVDPRRDHSFRVPRPDLTLTLGVPNACNGCHRDRDPRWAAEAAAGWWGRQRRPHYGEALHAGRAGLPGAEGRLAELAGDGGAPGIARATALELLGRRPGPGLAAVLGGALADPDPLVRAAAGTALEAVEPPERLRLGLPLLADDVRSVRLAAALALATVPPQLVGPGQRPILEAALEEHRQTQWLNADRPEAHLNLGWLHLQRGDPGAAEESYRTALRLAPGFVPASVNLADLYRAQGRDGEGEALLRRAVERSPGAADAHHALGLALVRRGRLAEALEALERAAGLAPGNPRYVYVWAVALHSTGRVERALEVLAEAHRRHPGDREILRALASFHRDAGDRAAAAGYARKLLELTPADPAARRLVEELEGGR